MPPHDATNRDSDAWSRLRQFAEKTNAIDNGRDRPGPASCRRAKIAPIEAALDDEEDGPITTRWAAG